MPTPPHHTIQTPLNSAGAIAIIRVSHPDPASLGLVDPGPNQLRLSDLLGIDQGVVMRADTSSVLLMPHGGIAIVRKISGALDALGVPLVEEDDPVATYPEADSEIEAHMLESLAHAASPDAIEVLIDHASRWAALGVRTIEEANTHTPSAHHAALSRLITPPIVAAVGRANVGKSTLVNALAGQRVALVADVAGTTRDHVGALVNLGGLVVRWVDTPGIDERISDGDAITLATQVIARADLIVHCIDPDDPGGALDPRLAPAIDRQTPVIRAGTRADLGEHRAGTDVRLSVTPKASRGLETLVGLARSALVPPAALADPTPWRFWDSINA